MTSHYGDHLVSIGTGRVAVARVTVGRVASPVLLGPLCVTFSLWWLHLAPVGPRRAAMAVALWWYVEWIHPFYGGKQGGFCLGGFWQKGFLSKGVFGRGCFCLRVFLSEGFFLGEGGFGSGVLERVSLERFFLKGGICPRTVCRIMLEGVLLLWLPGGGGTSRTLRYYTILLVGHHSIYVTLYDNNEYIGFPIHYNKYTSVCLVIDTIILTSIGLAIDTI